MQKEFGGHKDLGTAHQGIFSSYTSSATGNVAPRQMSEQYIPFQNMHA